MSVRILIGDMTQRLKDLPDASVDSCVCDPPYHLHAMTKRWANTPRSESTMPQSGPHRRTSKGFMGQTWDGGDVAFDPATWAEVLRVLKPGGHLIAFSGTRTYHRMVVAIEDAGFEIRDQLAWVYGSGFPKSLDVSKQTDKAAGAEREVIGQHKQGFRAEGSGIEGWQREAPSQHGLITAPATEAAQQWQGWGTALKPSWEPICLARKPLDGTVAQNVLTHGTGALNIDGCRIEADDGDDRARPPRTPNKILGGGRGTNLTASEHNAQGRWPANLCHDGSEEVLAGFPNEAGAAAPVHRRNADKFRGTYGAFKGNIDEQGSTFQGDSGSAARFFYCAKATTEERGAGLDGCETVSIVGSWGNAALNLKLLVDTGHSPPKVIAVSGTPSGNATQWNMWLFGSASGGRSLMTSSFTTSTAISSTTGSKTWSYLARWITNGNILGANVATVSGGSPAGNAGSSTQSVTITSGLTAFIPGVAPAPSGTQLTISVSEGWPGHPTVKPIALMRWLVRLVTPKGGTVLDPFMGSGSTGLAAEAEQFNFIGCELSGEYAAIAERRIRAAAGMFADISIEHCGPATRTAAA